MAGGNGSTVLAGRIDDASITAPLLQCRHKAAILTGDAVQIDTISTEDYQSKTILFAIVWTAASFAFAGWVRAIEISTIGSIAAVTTQFC